MKTEGCRPTSYNYFVFSVGGNFVGTLSPVLMNSRSDGAVQSVRVERGGSLSVDYDRYTPTDPLCCPSSTTTVTFGLASGVDGTFEGALDKTTTPNRP